MHILPPNGRRRVAERLADVLFLQIGMLGDDLRWRHTVGDEIDHMGDRDPQAAQRCAPGEHVGIMRDSIESCVGLRLVVGKE